MTITPNGWNEYKKLVLAEQGRLSDLISEINKKIDDIRQVDLPSLKTDIALLKLRAGLWGAVAGTIVAFVPVVAALIVKML